MAAEYLIGIGPCDGDGPTVQLTQWASWSWQQNVRDPDSFSMQGIPGTHPVTGNIEDTATDVRVYRNGTPLFRGRILGSTDTLNGDGAAEVSIGAVDYKGLLKRRILLRQMTFAQVAQAEIAWALIAEAQTNPLAPNPANSLGITQGLIPGGRPRDRTFEAGASIGELIDDLSQVLDGFEWEIDPLLRLNIGHPTLGQRRTLTLDFGGFVNSLSRVTDPSGIANGVWYSGGQGTTPTYVESTVVPQRQLWQTSLSDPDLVLQQTVEDKAGWALAERSVVRPRFTCTLSPGRWSPDLLSLGDTANLVAMFGRLNYVGLPVRVVELAVSVNADGAEEVQLALVQGDPE
jgi:hypothetical protein